MLKWFSVKNMYYIYIISCENGTLYTGITTDVARRFREHKSKSIKGAKYTRAQNVNKIEALWECENRSQASKLEWTIKKLSRKEKLSVIDDELSPFPNLAEYRRIKLKDFDFDNNERKSKMRIVVKIGTSTLAHKSGHLNIRRIESLCKIISDLKNDDNEIVLVSSGAIGMGVGKLSLKKRPDDIPTKQAAAAIGQCELMYTYDKLFTEYRHTVAQILVTGNDIGCDERRQNFENTLNRLLELGALPIINENDTVATEEIVIGDNDTLAAIVATSIKADLVILLSDIDGLYTSDPHKNKDATLIESVYELTPEIMALGGGKGSELGTGGMATKLKAAEISTSSGCDMIIMNGENPELLYDVIDGKPVGTRFYAEKK